MSQSFYGHGKLLITGEYLVLDGALALAIPTQKGQHLTVVESEKSGIKWTGIKESGEEWFSFQLDYEQFETSSNSKSENPEERLIQILIAAQKLNPKFLADRPNIAVTTRLEFNQKWGLGSSSTLIYMLAQWADVNPYELLEATFGGSGYDIACAGNDAPILYQRNLNLPKTLQTTFYPSFSDELFFVYLNKKRNSRDAIANYRKQSPKALEEAIKKVSGITQTLLTCDDLFSFKALIQAHERVISSVINQATVKQRLFNDYPGAIKSLGAWGGDFILATGNTANQEYFKNKGYETILSFEEMIYKG
ncbi:mevalonate kinase [Leeuwenhoekiella aestuarii]|uniref:Mevalonate kinase n=1 Tax=Leeuwenhoekiella aestuarii TaxID=2249426 RepID=A0A4Q0NRY0_9FLAO|nr:GYDIA family GHMP kinase [Leeuwenhoekiella aestuarii]RXG12721.1 mevalonate kinase [Leeuwenhoekiella aestuarii]RXG14668.1 mevalonate kinase [Leeuwenhoekiella aestuarii]